MRILAICITMLITLPALAETSAGLQVRAAQNMVVRSAWVQDALTSGSVDRPADILHKDLMRSSLELVAIAQQMARSHGQNVLDDLKKDPARNAELAYKYAKYSGCDAKLKQEIFGILMRMESCECDLLIPALAAFEFLKDQCATTSAQSSEAVEILVRELKKYKDEEVDVMRYWRILVEVQNQMAADENFANVINVSFSSELKNDIQTISKEKIWEPSHFGASLYAEDVFSFVSEDVRDYWLEKWRFGGQMNSPTEPSPSN